MVSKYLLPESRNKFATTFSSLKRVKLTVPYWQLAAHRIPTLWSLYRGLLKAAKGYDHIQWRVGRLFRLNRTITSPAKVKIKLARAHEWLEVFNDAAGGNERSIVLMRKYNGMINAKTQTILNEQFILEQKAYLEQLKNRPILTGTIMRPTIYNPPLPRMKPQPIHVSGMIHHRRRAREKRMASQEKWNSDLAELRHERQFESSLLQEVRRKGLSFEPFYDNAVEWETPIRETLGNIQACFDREAARANLPYTLELLEMVKEARRVKIANKTREGERQRRGEVLPITLKRMRKGLPAYLLDRLSPKRIELTRITRKPSEGGYTGKIKSKMGMKLKDDVTWRLEETGDPERQEELVNLEEEYWRMQEERRKRK